MVVVGSLLDCDGIKIKRRIIKFMGSGLRVEMYVNRTRLFRCLH